jgi:two-component system CheB/CheR fusion protein
MADISIGSQRAISTPAASGLAYVVVQHMDPTHKAMLGELPRRATPIPLHEVVDSQPVEADTVQPRHPAQPHRDSSGYHASRHNHGEAQSMPTTTATSTLIRGSLDRTGACNRYGDSGDG